MGNSGSEIDKCFQIKRFEDSEYLIYVIIKNKSIYDIHLCNFFSYIYQVCPET